MWPFTRTPRLPDVESMMDTVGLRSIRRKLKEPAHVFYSSRYIVEWPDRQRPMLVRRDSRRRQLATEVDNALARALATFEQWRAKFGRVERGSPQDPAWPDRW